MQVRILDTLGYECINVGDVLTITENDLSLVPLKVDTPTRKGLWLSLQQVELVQEVNEIKTEEVKMSKYKVGSWVEYLGDSSEYLTKGKSYLVVDSDNTTTPVKVYDDENDLSWLEEGEFEVVEPTPEVKPEVEVVNPATGKYKVGQQVKYLGKSGGDLTKGKVYTITEVEPEDFTVCVLDDAGDEQGFSMGECEAVPEKEETLQTMTVNQLIGFVYGYAHAGGDVSKLVSIAFKGDK